MIYQERGEKMFEGSRIKLPNLKIARTYRGLTQSELALKAQLSLVTISQIENGVTATYANTAKKIADALGYEIYQLMSDDESVLR